MRFAVRTLSQFALSASSTVLPIAVTRGLELTGLKSDAALFAWGLAIASYLAQVAGAWYIEARLVGHTRAELRMPAFVVGLAALGASVACTVAGVGGIVGLLLVLGALELSRQVAVASDQLGYEAMAAGTVIAASIAAVALDSTRLVISVVSVLAFAAICVRTYRVGLGRLRPRSKGSLWVVCEVAIVGSSQPFIMTLVLTILGPEAALAFRYLVGIGNVFAPVLGVLRLRLLVEPSRRLVMVSGASTLALAAIVLTAQWLGLWRFVFGDVWAEVTGLSLFAMILWKIAVALSTLPFTALRRLGAARLTFSVRLVSTAGYLLVGLWLAPWGIAPTAFGLAFSELIAIAVYSLAWRLVRSNGS